RTDHCFRSANRRTFESFQAPMAPRSISPGDGPPPPPPASFGASKITRCGAIVVSAFMPASDCTVTRLAISSFRSASAQRRFEPPQRVQMAGREGEARAPWLGDEKGGAEGLPRLYLLRPPVGLLAREADATFQRQRGVLAARLARLLMPAGGAGLALALAGEVRTPSVG